MLGQMSIVDLFIASPTMVVLLLCSIVTTGFAVERMLYFKSSSTNVAQFMKGLRERMKSGNVAAAREYCKAGKSAVSRVMTQALNSVGRDHEEVAQRLNTAIEVERVEMERNLSILGTMSNIAPLLGLFGTVIGIIRAFADIARTGSGGSSVVAMGVSEALMTTAAGIVVAVIATVFFNLFVRRIRTRTVELEDAREEFFSIVSSVTARPKAQPQAKRADTASQRTSDEIVAASLLT